MYYLHFSKKKKKIFNNLIALRLCVVKVIDWLFCDSSHCSNATKGHSHSEGRKIII